MESLIEAAIQGNSPLVRTILQQGTSPDAPDAHGETALNWAAHLGHTAVVKDLLAAGADREMVGDFHRATPLLLAAYGGHRGIVALLAVLADVNARDPRGATALMLALEPHSTVQKLSRRVLSIVETLIQAGADLDLQDQKGNTALLWASQVGNSDAVRLLYNAGADVRIKNHAGLTALDVAAQHDHADIIALLGNLPLSPKHDK